jgi:hypothetical protein
MALLLPSLPLLLLQVRLQLAEVRRVAVGASW